MTRALATDDDIKGRGMALKKDQDKKKHGQTAEEKEMQKPAESGSAEAENAKPQENEQPQKNETEKKEQESGDINGKQPSEIDILKLYLSQTMEKLKKREEELEKLKASEEQAKEQVLRCKERYDALTAEYENYRRRTAVEKENLSTDAISKAVLALLPALDNLERAMPFANSNHESFVKGVEMTLRQLQDAFKSLGVEEIEAQGAVFDPQVHEAVMHVDDENAGESVITEVFQKGYKLGDKVIRHSVVKVAN